jgi:hypothetical protein
MFSRCVVGKNKWFWVAFTNADCDGGKEISGYATSARDAEKQARAAIQAEYGLPPTAVVPVWRLPAYYAAGVHRGEAIKRRADQESVDMDAEEVS